MDGVGKTDATINAYLQRGRQLWQRAIKEHGLSPDEASPQSYLAWLQTLLPTLKPASRRQYIASSRELLLAMHEKLPRQAGWNEDLVAAIHQVQQMQSSHYSSSGSSAKRWRGRTSSQKTKKCSTNDILKLAKETAEIRGKWIKPALLWMSANILVGLRPCEWRYAELAQWDGKTWLVVRNAKNTNGRAHGEVRHLDLTDMKPIELRALKLQLASISAYSRDAGLWKAYYQGVRQTLHRITRRFLPSQRKYPTLYSSRHQFAANAKATGMGKSELGALMGHAVDTTAGSHYGRKKHGSGTCRIKPDMTEVEKVRERSAIRQRGALKGIR